MSARAFAIFSALCCLATLLCALATRAEPLAVVAAKSVRVAEPRARQFGEGLALPPELSGHTRHPLLHFTFDDGPDPVQTPRLLDALDAAGVKATFFFSASRFLSGERRNARAVELAREVARRGHAIGSHSFDHQRMARLAPPALREQLARNHAAFEHAFGRQSLLFRPPFGSSNRALRGMLRERGYSNVLWNIGLADWVERPPQAIEETFFKVLARNERRDGDRGGIVLMHDTHAFSVDAFLLIMGELERRNCEALQQEHRPLYDVVDDLEPFAAEPDARWLGDRQRRLRQRLQRSCSVR
ncbi:MAG: polysaccharide deacetylase family protein [Myxococcales bacterium]|nr:polysaccharide deacetylase family protein [Myxococcales bacterium]